MLLCELAWLRSAKICRPPAYAAHWRFVQAALHVALGHMLISSDLRLDLLGGTPPLLAVARTPHTHMRARHGSPCGLPLPSSGPSADRCRSSGAMPRRACRHAPTGAAMPFFYILSGFVMTLGYGQTTYGECSGAITELRILLP